MLTRAEFMIVTVWAFALTDNEASQVCKPSSSTRAKASEAQNLAMYKAGKNQHGVVDDDRHMEHGDRRKGCGRVGQFFNTKGKNKFMQP